MSFDSCVDFAESLKNVPFAFICVVILPLLMVISPVNGAQSFPVYRANQMDIGSASFGE